MADVECFETVLDIGTGTGAWAIDFADEYPKAEVIGTDLSPIQRTLSLFPLPFPASAHSPTALPPHSSPTSISHANPPFPPSHSPLAPPQLPLRDRRRRHRALALPALLLRLHPHPLPLRVHHLLADLLRRVPAPAQAGRLHRASGVLPGIHLRRRQRDPAARDGRLDH
jgi:hypothetical protein